MKIPYLAAIVCATVIALGTTQTRAENEPADDTPTGSSALAFGAADTASAAGTLSGEDTDWYTLRNTGRYRTIEFTLDYTRIALDSFHAIEIFDANFNSIDIRWTDDADPFDTTSLTLGRATPDATYHIAVRGSSGPETTYTLAALGSAPITQTLWDYYYGLASSTYAYYVSIGDENSGLAYWFYYRAYGDQALRNSEGNTALAQKEFYLGLAYFYYTFLTGSSAIYYYYLYIGYSELTYYLELGDSASANLYYNFYYDLALSAL